MVVRGPPFFFQRAQSLFGEGGAKPIVFAEVRIDRIQPRQGSRQADCTHAPTYLDAVHTRVFTYPREISRTIPYIGTYSRRIHMYSHRRTRSNRALFVVWIAFVMVSEGEHGSGT